MNVPANGPDLVYLSTDEGVTPMHRQDAADAIHDAFLNEYRNDRVGLVFAQPEETEEIGVHIKVWLAGDEEPVTGGKASIVRAFWIQFRVERDGHWSTYVSTTRANAELDLKRFAGDKPATDWRVVERVESTVETVIHERGSVK